MMMNDGSDTEGKRARLRVLRERYEQSQQAQATLDAVSMQASPEQPLVPIQRRHPESAVGGPRRQAAGSLVQRVVNFLTQEGPGAQFVADTRIRQDRLGQLVQFLKRRGATAEGQQAQRARAVLAYLTEATPGDNLIAGVNITHAQQLVDMTRKGQTRRLAQAMAGNRARIIEMEQIEQKSLEAAGSPVMPSPVSGQGSLKATVQEEGASEESLGEMLEKALRLSQELAELQRRICQKIAHSPVVNASSPAIGAPPGPLGEATDRTLATAPVDEPHAEWFMDFLE
ncbi:MAG: hypothetical protein H6974_00275 [Gammaproteobacteria bacterium]|nr:hypothetical protein [Gammaproteobacteria bacterium]